MLVKHNLLSINPTDVISNTSQSKFFDIYRKSDSISFKGIEKPESPYVLGCYYQHYKNNFSKFIIKNTGESHIIINEPYKNSIKQSDITLLPGEYTEISRKNLNDGRCTWIQIPNIDDYGKSYEIKIINLMITDGGFSDVYLPNINTLPTDKQVLLPPEGQYKEIQPQ